MNQSVNSVINIESTSCRMSMKYVIFIMHTPWCTKQISNFSNLGSYKKSKSFYSFKKPYVLLYSYGIVYELLEVTISVLNINILTNIDKHSGFSSKHNISAPYLPSLTDFNSPPCPMFISMTMQHYIHWSGAATTATLKCIGLKNMQMLWKCK